MLADAGSSCARGASVRALALLALVLCAAACNKSSSTPPPGGGSDAGGSDGGASDGGGSDGGGSDGGGSDGGTLAGARLLLGPSGALLQGQGDKHAFTLRAFDGDGKEIDPAVLDPEWVSTQPDQVAIESPAARTANAVAQAGRGSSVLVVRSKLDATIISNPALLVIGKTKAGVRLVSDAEVLYPPPRALAHAIDTNTRPEGFSVPDAAGHVTIGGFKDEDIVALYEAPNPDAGQISGKSALVLKGAAPNVGDLLFASEGAQVMGKVVKVQQGTGTVLVQTEATGVLDLFDDLLFTYDSAALTSQGLLADTAGSQLTNGRAGRKATANKKEAACKVDVGYKPNAATVTDWHVNPHLTGAFEFDATGGTLHHMLVRAGLIIDASASIAITFSPKEKFKIDCKFNPILDIGPLPAPGPLAFLFAWGGRVQPFLKGSFSLTAGPSFQAKPAVSVHLPFVYTAVYDAGGGFRVFSEGDATGDFKMEALGFDFATDEVSDLGVDITANAGGRGALIALIGGNAIDLLAGLTSWIPWLSDKIETIKELTELELLTLELGPEAEGKWFWTGPALRDQKDDGGLDLSLKVAVEVFPTFFDALKKLLGFAGFAAPSAPSFDHSFHLYERPTARKSFDGETTKLHASVDGSGVSDNTVPLLIKDGSKVDFTIDLAKVPDAVVGVALFKGNDNPALDTKLVALTASGVNASGTWTVPSGFCDEIGSKTQQVHAVAFNKIYGGVPAAAWIGHYDVTCSPIQFLVDDVIVEEDKPWTNNDELCPGPHFVVKLANGIKGTPTLTSTLALGGASEDFGSATGAAVQLEKWFALKPGSYTWKGKLQVKGSDGSQGAPTEVMRTLTVGANCKPILCGANGEKMADGASVTVNAPQCPAKSVRATCESNYAKSPELQGVLTGNLEGTEMSVSGSMGSVSKDLEKGTHAIAGKILARTVGSGGANQPFNFKGTVEVKCKDCPNDQVTDACNCPMPPPNCGPPPPGGKYGGQYGNGPSPASANYVVTHPSGPPPANGNHGGEGWGDPHLTTQAGYTWTSLELGEFIYARSAVSGGVEVQVRHQRLPGFEGWASFSTAAAVRAKGRTFEVRMPRNAAGQIDLSHHRPMELLIDGQLATLNPQVYVLDAELSFRVAADNGLEIFLLDPTLLQTPANPQDAVTRVRIGTRGEQNLLRQGADPNEPVLAIDVAVESVGPYGGVLGRFDTRDGSRDFEGPDGLNHGSPDLAFMNSWRIIDVADSLFTYLPGEGPATFALRQTSSLPTGDALIPFATRVHAMLRDTCGVSEEQLTNTNQPFLDQLALELAAGRSEHNMISSGICFDARLQPPAQELVSFQLGGLVTLSGRPDVPVAGARVRVVAREIGHVLCDTTSQTDGRWGCSTTDRPDGYALANPLHLDLELTGRGPRQERTLEVISPAPGSAPLQVSADFEAAVQALLDLSGVVRDPQGVPVAGANVRVDSPLTSEIVTGPDGSFEMILALPDGQTSGEVALRAVSANGLLAGAATKSFAITALGVTAIQVDVALASSNGAPLPPIENLRRVQFGGKVTNQVVKLERGFDLPLASVTINVTSTAFRAPGCTGVSKADGTWSCLAVLTSDAAFTAQISAGALGSGPAQTFDATQVPGPGDTVSRTIDLALNATTLALTGIVDAVQGPISGARVHIVASSGEEVTASAGSDGHYEALLALHTASAAAGRLDYDVTLAAPGTGGEPALKQSVAFSAAAAALSPLETNLHLTNGTAVIGGTVVNALAANAPVPGAAVSVKGNGNLLCRVTTDSAGRFACGVSSQGGGVLTLSFEVSGKGVGTFNTFGGQPALLDLGTVPAGGVVPVLPSRELAVSPTTLSIDGNILDAHSLAVAGATVGANAGSDPQITVSGDNGRFSIILALEEGRTVGSVALSALWAADQVSAQASRSIDFTAPAHTLLAIDGSMRLDGDTGGGDPAARLKLDGLVKNLNKPGAGVAGASVDIRLAGSGRPVCNVTAGEDGRYSCSLLLTHAPTSPASFEYRVSYGGVAVAPVATFSKTFARSVAVESEIAQDVDGSPTTLVLRGRITGGGTAAVAGAKVVLTGNVAGSATSDSQGDYEIVAATIASIATADLTVTSAGLSASRHLTIPLTTGARTDFTADLDLPQRRVALTGTVRNALLTSTYLRDAQVLISTAQGPICLARLVPSGSGTPAAFACPTDLVLGSAASVPLTYTVTNAWGTAGGSVTLTSPNDIPPGGQRHIVALDLQLAATALQLTGTIRDVSHQAFAGATVSASVGDVSGLAISGADGSYAIGLTLPDSLTDGSGSAQTASLLVSARAGNDLGQSFGSLPVNGGALNNATRDVDFSAVTNLFLRGQVQNGAANARPLPGAQVRIYRDGIAPSLGLLCDGASDFNGNYFCFKSLVGEAVNSVSLRYELAFEGAAIAAPVTSTFDTTPGGAFTNTLFRDLIGTTTAVEISGKVRDGQGTPIAGVFVTLNGASIAGSTTASDGSYDLLLPLSLATTSFSGTLTANRNGNTATAAVSIAHLNAAALNPVSVDIALLQRQIQLDGRISNSRNPSGAISGAHVLVTLGGQTICDTTTDGNTGSNLNFFCPTLVRTVPDAFTLHLTVDGPYGTTATDIDLASGDIPPAGGFAEKRLFASLAATTVEVSGHITRDAAPLVNATVRLAWLSGGISDSTQASVSGGAYDLKLTVPDAAGSYNVLVSASDGTNAAQAHLSGALPAGTLVSLTQDLDIATVTPGSARWTTTTLYPFTSNRTPALTVDGNVVVSAGRTLKALNPNDGTLIWTADFNQFGFNTTSPSIDATGFVYVGDSDGYVHSFTSAGAARWHARHGTDSTFVWGLAVGSSAIYAVQGNFGDARLRALSPTDGSELWSVSLPGQPSSVVVLPDASVLAVTSAGLVAASAAGDLRWTRPDFWTGGVAITGAEEILAIRSNFVLAKLDLNGIEQWSVALPGGNASSPAIDADGTIVVAVDSSLVRVSSIGEILQQTVVVADNGLESVFQSSPALGANGAVYVGSSAGDPARPALYAVDSGFAPLWNHRPGSFDPVQSPLPAPNFIYIHQGAAVRAVISATSSGLLESAWPKLYRDSQNTSRSPASAVQRREVRLSGHVLNANHGARVPFPLQGIAVSVSDADSNELCDTLTDNGGSFSCSILTTTLAAFDLTVDVDGRGLETSGTVTADAAAVGSTISKSIDFELPVTTLQISGTVSSASLPVADARLVILQTNGTWVDDPQLNSGSAGEYSTYVLYDDPPPDQESILLRADKFPQGLKVNQVAPALVSQALATVTLDFDLQNRPLRWQRNLPDEVQNFFDVPVANPTTGTVYFANLVCNDGCRSTFAGISADGNTVLLPHNAGGQFNIPGRLITRPTIGSDGTVYTGGAHLLAFSEDLTLRADVSASSAGFFTSPAVLPGTNGAGLMVVADIEQAPQIAALTQKAQAALRAARGAHALHRATGIGALRSAITAGLLQRSTVPPLLRRPSRSSTLGQSPGSSLGDSPFQAVRLLLDFSSGTGAQVWGVDLDNGPLLDSNVALGTTNLPSGGRAAYFGTSDVLVGIDTAGAANARLLFQTPLGVGSFESGPLTGVWNDGTQDYVHLLVPGTGLGAFTAAGVLRDGWPPVDEVPTDFGGFAVLPGGVTVFIDNQNRVVGLDPTGLTKWVFESPDGGDFFGSIALDSSGTVYVITEQAVHALKDPVATESPLVWSFFGPSDDSFVGGAAVGGQNVYVTTQSGKLYALQK